MSNLLKRTLSVITIVILAGCLSVRDEDLDAWVGEPVTTLELHPLLNTLPLEIRTASDGTEIRNYVNGANLGSCFSNGNIFIHGAQTGSLNTASFCSTQFAACNNIFYIRNGRVIKYAPTGSGGARCYTDDRLKPMRF